SPQKKSACVRWSLPISATTSAPRSVRSIRKANCLSPGPRASCPPLLGHRLAVLRETMTATAHQQIHTGEWLSHNADETLNLGAQIAQQLGGGEILLLSGPLGAGKTVFVKGLAGTLGIDSAEVTSPSFTLVNLYNGRLTLYHIDLFRLDEG